MEVIIIITTVFQDTCTHGQHLPIEDTRMGCFGEKKRKYFFSGTVRYTLIPIFFYLLYTQRKGNIRKEAVVIYFVLSPWFLFA